MRTFDVSRFHPDCGTKQFIGTGDGMYVVCPKCGIVAHCADCGVRISPASAYIVGKPDERLSITQPSVGVPSPGNIVKTSTISNTLI